MDKLPSFQRLKCIQSAPGITKSVCKQIGFVSLQSDEKQLTLFTDRRSKLYMFNPSKAPESLLVEDSSHSQRESILFTEGQLREDCNQSRRTSLTYPSGRSSTQAFESTMFYSPDAASASGEFMSALDQLHTESSTTDKSPIDKLHQYRLASPNTSTPDTQAVQTAKRVSLSNMYRLSSTCCICLQERADNQLVSHDKCGRLHCRQCLQVSNTFYIVPNDSYYFIPKSKDDNRGLDPLVNEELSISSKRS